MRIAACTVVALLAISLDGWAQPPHDRSQREFGLSHRPDPRGHHRFGGSDGGFGTGGPSGMGGPSLPTGGSSGSFGPAPLVGAAPAVPSMYLDLPSIPGIPSIRERARETIPDCIGR